jgi:hypothetical protein
VQFGFTAVPQTLGVTAPQISGVVQVPQDSMIPPQPSGMGPQFAFTLAQVTFVQGGTPQTLGLLPPPQVFGSVQSPHLTVPLQPSLCVPHMPWQSSA